MGDLAALLTGFGDRYALARMNTKFPTSGLAVLDFSLDRWADVAERSGRLDRFVTPASLDPGLDDD
jgi:phosphohistidine phosphatase